MSKFDTLIVSDDRFSAFGNISIGRYLLYAPSATELTTNQTVSSTFYEYFETSPMGFIQRSEHFWRIRVENELDRALNGIEVRSVQAAGLLRRSPGRNEWDC
ncbi:hypothetical protein AB6A40_011286 [Gnathostoma spinigerum]|uniref:Uncharacterized protein n=1 Tax=Gnathostoma spinigerum TaxID=75299 RepID=A0ABD6F452_9BILA